MSNFANISDKSENTVSINDERFLMKILDIIDVLDCKSWKFYDTKIIELFFKLRIGYCAIKSEGSFQSQRSKSS
jgi:hypothetical protein